LSTINRTCFAFRKRDREAPYSKLFDFVAKISTHGAPPGAASIRGKLLMKRDFPPMTVTEKLYVPLL